MSLGVYETYGEFTGKSSSFEDVLVILKRFSRDSLLWNCAALNYGARVWQSNIPEQSATALSGLIASIDFYFPAQISARLRSRALSRSDPRAPFHRRQLLALQKLVLQHSPASGADINREPYVFGLLLLMVSDHLHPNKSRLTETIRSPLDFATLLSELLPVSEVSDERLGTNIRMVDRMLGELTKVRRADSSFFDIVAEFEKATKASYQAFRAFVLGSVAYLDGSTFETIVQDPGRAYLNYGRFVGTSLSRSELLSIFASLSKSGQSLERRIHERDFGIHDFTELRRWPLVERWFNVGTKDQWCGYLVTDPIYLFDKLIAAPYWSASNTHQLRFRRFWGSLFEDYCHEVLQEAIKEPGAKYVADVKNKDGQQLCDGLLLEGHRLVIFEYKSFMLSAEAKYSGDAKLLLESLERNLVRTPDGQKKGTEQLAATIRYLFGPERWIERVFPQWKEITEVFPCIVTLDSIGGAVGLSPMLQMYMPDIRGLEANVCPIFCLWVRELERKAPFFRSIGVTGVLDVWRKVNPSLGTPLGQIDANFGKASGLRSVDEALRKVTADGNFLFPNQMGPSPGR